MDGEISARHSVLVVEDEPLMRWSLAETLIERGHAVAEATDAATALRAFRDVPRPFDVVLVDLCLPDSQDLSLVAAMRRRSPSSVIVLMTAYGTREIAADARALGVREVLAKPFNLQTVCEVIEAGDRDR